MAITSGESSLKKGPWTPEEDQKLIDCIQKHGLGSWKRLPILAGLNRCGKSCRLRWTNYLRPDIKRGAFSDQEQMLIIDLHAKLGNKWSAIASHLPGRTDNEIKNFWNTHLKKRLIQNGIDPVTHMQITHLSSFSPVLSQFLGCTSSRDPTWENAVRFQTDAARLAKLLLIGNILQLLNTGTSPRLPMEVLTCSSESAQFTSSIQQGINNIPQPVFQKVMATNSFMEVNRNGFGGLSTAQTNYTLPDLVPAYPDTDQTQNSVIRPADFSNLSSVSMTFEGLGDFMDDESSNYDWKQILDRESFLP